MPRTHPPTAEIEDSLIRMYRQPVWFRAGLPRKGRGSYFESWQVAIGANVNQTGVSSKGSEMTGLHVPEISRLLRVLQWKDRPACFLEIQKIARDECRSIFLAPHLHQTIEPSRLDDYEVSVNRSIYLPKMDCRLLSDRTIIQRFCSGDLLGAITGRWQYR